jgi:hypothetical protein
MVPVRIALTTRLDGHCHASNLGFLFCMFARCSLALGGGGVCGAFTLVCSGSMCGACLNTSAVSFVYAKRGCYNITEAGKIGVKGARVG